MKPKLITLTILFLVATSVFGQNNIESINGFKYAYVDILTYQNNQQDIFGITEYLRNELSKKGVIVLAYNKDLWPQEAKDDPCLIGEWVPSHEPGGFNAAKAGYLVKNCKDKIVYQNYETASHFGYYYNQNVPLAMQKAFKPILSYHYNFNEALTAKIDYPQVETTNETEQSLKTYFDTNKLDPIEGIYKSYQNETLGYYKFGITVVR